ncbi:transcriptional regulator, partial [Vibrio sp. 1262-1]|nr:transcriptional regulator [Vibrio sp. 1262-1]
MILLWILCLAFGGLSASCVFVIMLHVTLLINHIFMAQQNKKTRTTLQDVADQVGVTKMTVSR